MISRKQKFWLEAAIFFCMASLFPTAAPSPAARQAANPWSAAARADHSVVDGTFHSESLNRDMPYRVVLPHGYKSGTKRFAVLYLLHGLYGNYTDWTTRTKLQEYSHSVALLIVMPDAGDSWYTNSATVPGDKFEDYIVKDLVPEIDARFRTKPSRSARAVPGIFMGGYGALKFALKYPRLFAFAGSLSGGLDAPLQLEGRVPEYREKLLATFGPTGDPARAANDLFQLLNQEVSPFPYLYIACGTEDGFLPINRDFVSSLPSRKIAYEYHETPGGHTWNYWDGAIQDLLRSAAKALNPR